ncbi:esterase/lipase family protein [Deinococcus yavapaiensis]|uniref:Triacylglycerol esterase/lipase EstA (Alpha/beta hydrolase family) n=1 Tax=Deinococcus yavapaiensis KR-236 TaxID=694435 RepID=A0A318S7V9_9DEIO|nr:hypothetical protein [Deinococcus yavapaiensis]PYE51861.1 triacylglycerol esterase/lipase EstA (alpha/beta hydrolase family) [Deinococcus yavapaiensis KR-236]
MPRPTNILLASALLALTAMRAPAQTLAPDYVFAHGLSNSCETFFGSNGTNGVCTTADPSTLVARIKSGANAAVNVSGRTIETKAIGVADQAQQLAQDLVSERPKIIVGHSQGVIRSRYALQVLKGQTRGVRGLISISGPNGGAPIVTNAPAFARRVLSDLTTSGLLQVAVNAQPAYNTMASIANALREKSLPFFYDAINSPQNAFDAIMRAANVNITDPGFTDLAPGSALLTQLSNQSCRWTFNLGTTNQFTYICSPTDGPKLDASVAVASIRGKNNLLFGGLLNADKKPLLDTANAAIRAYSYTMQAPCRLSFNLYRAACDSMEATWRLLSVTENVEQAFERDIIGAEGASAGDGVVPLWSQSVHGSSPYIGGTPVTSPDGTQNFDIDSASHGGENAILGKIDTFYKVRQIQEAMGMTVSR